MKITKTQLRRIIKEEIQRTMDEGFLDFLTGGGLTATEDDIVKLRAKAILAQQPNQHKEDAIAQATEELKDKKLDRSGNLKGPESEPSSGSEVRYDASSLTNKDRADLAAEKRKAQQAQQAGRKTYAQHSSDAEARKTLRARGAQYRR
jgi:molybdopterin-biosynthesis enzyme MoeA-like protein